MDAFFGAKRARGAGHGPAGKKGGRDGFIWGAIPIGRNAKEQEIGATDIRGTGLAHLMAPNDTTLQPAESVSIRADIDIIPNRDNSAETHLDFRVVTQGVEIGAGWIRRGENSGKEYVSLSLAAPEFGPRKLYANLGRAAGQDNDSIFATMWNPSDQTSAASAPPAREPFSRSGLFRRKSRRGNRASMQRRGKAHDAWRHIYFTIVV